MDVGSASMLDSCCTRPPEDLNTSDHLPLTACLSYDASICTNDQTSFPKKIDWLEARKNGSLEAFTAEVQTRLEPLFMGVHDNTDEISREIEQVAGILTEVAEKLLPCVQPRRRTRYKDDTLSHLCAQSHAARAAWRDAGSPSDGPLSEEKNRLRRAVRKRVRWCAARAERIRTQRRDRLFSAMDNRRFRTPQKRKSRCSKLVVGEETVQDPEALLKVWTDHFKALGESKLEDAPDSSERKSNVDALEMQSHGNEEFLLDVPFSAEEVAGAVRKLKGKKAPGPDGLMAEHLKAGGEAVVIWLMRTLNAITELEEIPDVLKRGIIVPVYKAGGRDPLKTDSYRGITLTSMISKVLEFLVLDRLESVFVSAGLPHINQSAYRRAVSCADAIFATQEVVARYLRGGSRVYMCLYDLQKAFDSVEYPVLLEKLYNAGVNGKMWRLLRNWYTGGSCQVKLDGKLSHSFEVERGVRQGSVLSPALFLLVMDPLLKQLQISGLGLSVNRFYAGGFLHADDIRTLATSEDSLQRQVGLVKAFAEENLLRLNVKKCEIVLFSQSRNTNLPVCEVEGTVLPAGDVGKCLGYWWKGDLLATKCVEENIKKARRCFFHYGSIGVFQGDICPLSSRSVLETCVMPVLLYGCENWIMTEALWEKLEAFQGELVKRILKWPKHHSNTAAATALEVPTMRCRVLIRKLSFLQHVVKSNSTCLSGTALLALSDDTASLCLVRECKELEEVFGTHFTHDIIRADAPPLREVKDAIQGLDRTRLREKCTEKAPLIAAVARRTTWSKLWDCALDIGSKSVKGLQNLSRVMSHHGFGNHPCPLCDTAPLPTSVLDHLLDCHSSSLFLGPTRSSDGLIELLEQLHLGVLCNFSKLYTF